MKTFNTFRLGPMTTPPIIKRLIAFCALFSILVSFVDPIFHYFNRSFGPELWFSLSLSGIKHYLWYQPISYLFVQYSAFDGITMGWLFTLGFNLYLLWVFGSAVLDWIGKKSFLILYFASGALAGLLAVACMPLFNQWAILSGQGPALLAILTVWTMMLPEAEIFLFFLIPIQAKKMFMLVAAALFFVNLSSWDAISLILYFSAIFFGYLYGLLALGFKSPFKSMMKVDQFFLDWKAKLFGKEKAQIFSFKTGEKLSDDDAFVDEMLKKISKNGKDSLTSSEKKRLDQISAKKRGDKK